MPKLLQVFDESAQNAYTKTMDWLDKNAVARNLNVFREVRRKLHTILKNPTEQDFQQLYKMLTIGCFRNVTDDNAFDIAACQFYTYFPIHTFKVTHTLSEVFGIEELIIRLRNNPNLTIIDIGCGGGSATVAFILFIRDLVIKNRLSTPISILCVGSDPNFGATLIYEKMLRELAEEVRSLGISLSIYAFDGGIPNDSDRIIDALRKYRQQKQVPLLSQVFLMQVNIVSPLSDQHSEENRKRAIRESLGLGSPCDDIPFGEREAGAYQILFSTAPIDYLHIITIGTDHHMLLDKLRNMETAIVRTFQDTRHEVRTLLVKPQNFDYRNPSKCFWHDRHIRRTQKLKDPFHVSICTLTNSDLLNDHHWNKIVDPNNMERAWAKVRRGLFRESLFDEVEIRLFDINASANLARLIEQLNAYAYRFTPLLHYAFPKNVEKTRPRSLTLMEEEVLSVAIIQQLGNRVSALGGRSYAYRISTSTESEYLYEPWWNSFTKFLRDARTAAKLNPKSVVIRTDIASFYTDIVQNRLHNIAHDTLSLSDRVDWLLRLLLNREVDANRVGRGLTQGGIGSGFYANLYLSELDERFGENNPWGLFFFRYVDDMIFIIPKGEDKNSVVRELQSVLAGLDLSLNIDKTQSFPTAADFLEAIELEIDDPVLEDDSYDAVTDSLWLMDSEYRQYFGERFDESNDLWWSALEVYRSCLTELGVYVTLTDLSRKIYRLLFNPDRYRETSKRSQQLKFPPLPTSTSFRDVHDWKVAFIRLNHKWCRKVDELRDHFTRLFQAAWSDLQNPESLSKPEEKQRQRWLRYSSNRLVLLGLNSIASLLSNILVTEPWRMREPIYIIEHLARQGHSDVVKQILRSFEIQDHPMSEYLRAICLRALRFVPMQVDFSWEIVVSYAISGSIVERLMATESWILLDPSSPPIKEEHIDAVWSELWQREDLPERLKRNYLLILSKYLNRQSLIELVSSVVLLHSTDHTLRAVADSIQSGHGLDLLDYEEPASIRRNYYGARREDNDKELEHAT